MFKHLNKFKDRLASVKVSSLRYRLGVSLWDEDRIRDAHACTFYWFYLPTTVFGWFIIGILGGAFLAFTYLIFVPLAWLFGGKQPKHLDVDSVYDRYEWHPYGYSPIDKKTHFMAPQQMLIALGVIVFLGVTLTASDIAWGHLLAVLGIFLAITAAFSLLGWLLSRRATKNLWNRLCPDLRVVREEAEQA